MSDNYSGRTIDRAARRHGAAALGAALCLLGCGATAPECVRTERIAVQLAPQKQLNQDRDGYSRSLVLRLYQLDSAEQFRQIGFDQIWQNRDDGTPQEPVVASPEELTLVPGKRERRDIARAPEAAFFAVVANFREHEPGSGWQAIVPLPEPKNLCVRDVSTVAAHVTVELKDYGLALREQVSEP
jgi:type VI secretion system VasD/TssJ family lipoprotein